jgi:hypothetical protein
VETVVLVTFRISGLLTPVKIASKTAPNQDQIYKKILDMVKDYNLSGEVQFKKLIQEKGKKMYIYQIAERRCVVIVEKLQKIIEFETIE